MEVIDVNGNPMETYDLQTGHIVEGRKTVHHEAVEGATEQGHYETIREYPETGGKDVKWVIDVLGVQEREAWDEEVPTYTYVPYTPEEIAAGIQSAAPSPGDSVEARLDALESLIVDTQYQLALSQLGLSGEV